MKSKPIQFTPRGLSRVQAAYYVGVSSSLFDQMVVDGRMPKPREINRRRVWDRQQVDAAFDLLPGGSEELAFSINYEQPSEPIRWEPVPRRKATSEEIHQTYIEALGYDPRGMTEAEKAAAETKRIEEWTADVLASPLWKKERLALAALLKTRGQWLRNMHLKGASASTMERLEARGFVITKIGPWNYLDTGKRAPHNTEHYQLTSEGEQAAARRDIVVPFKEVLEVSGRILTKGDRFALEPALKAIVARTNSRDSHLWTLPAPVRPKRDDICAKD